MVKGKVFLGKSYEEYKTLEDSKLIYGVMMLDDEYCLLELIERGAPNKRYLVNAFKKSEYITDSEIESIFIEILYRCIPRFDIKNKCSFITFVSHCARNSILRQINNNKKHSEFCCSYENIDTVNLSSVTSAYSINPALLFEQKTDRSYALGIYNGLTDIQRDIVDARAFKSLSFLDIANKHNKSIDDVYKEGRTLSRLLRKRKK